MPYLLLALIGVIIIVWLVLKLKEADPKTLQKSFRLTLLLILMLVTIYAALTGRIGIVAAAAIGLLTLFGPQIKSCLKGNAPHYLPKDMTVTDAIQILGVSQNASESEIQSAYHRLIAKNHPDHGGSKYIAQQLNQARDLLLKNLKQTD